MYNRSPTNVFPVWHSCTNTGSLIETSSQTIYYSNGTKTGTNSSSKYSIYFCVFLIFESMICFIVVPTRSFFFFFLSRQLADFGFARRTNGPILTNHVVAKQYRPPELIYCSAKNVHCLYGPEVDMWCLGLVLIEV
jgi:serine/threonine protein kinase